MKVYLVLSYYDRDMITVAGIFSSERKATTAIQNYKDANGSSLTCDMEIIELDKEIDLLIA